jgi:hypothetical protein
MRIVSFFRKNDKTWVSPGSLWSAIRSGELLTIIKPPNVENETVLACFYDATAFLKQKWLFGVKNSVISVIWCLFFAFGLFWPPLATKMPEIVRKVLLIGLGIGIGSETVSAIMILRRKRLLAAGKAKLAKALEKRAISLDLSPPAAFYRSGANFRVSSAKVAILALLAVILLNSVVLAFPAHPAVVSNSYVTKLPVLVWPVTQWEWRQEYYTGTVIGLLAVPENEKSVWAISVTYRVQHLDMLRDSGPWRSWLGARLNWIVSKINEEAWQNFPPEMGQDERVVATAEAYRNPELQDMLKEVLTDHFNEHHAGIMKLSITRLEVVEMSISDYVTAYKKQS